MEYGGNLDKKYKQNIIFFFFEVGKRMRINIYPSYGISDSNITRETIFNYKACLHSSQKQYMTNLMRCFH